jgi:hypothetical protein
MLEQFEYIYIDWREEGGEGNFHVSTGREAKILMGRGQWPNFFFFGRSQVS